MNRLILSLALFLSLAASGLRAEEVQATVMAVTGKASFVEAGGTAQDLKAGTLLRSGARLSTQADSVVTLLLADGSKLSLGSSTDLTLSELSKSGNSYGNVFNLIKGLLKASVQKLTVGSKFEVNSIHGVAAVKGTEYEVSSDDDGMEVRVKEGRVWLQDSKREHVEEVGKEHKCRIVRERLEKTIEMRREEWERFGNWAKQELPSRSDAAQARAQRLWDSLRPDQKLKYLCALRASLGDTWADITQLTQEERQTRWKDRIRNVDERKLASEEAHVDFALGKSILDRKLRRVRFDEFILRPAANQLQFLNYSNREGRTDLVNAINTYNQNLPRRLGDAKGINNRIWAQVQAPDYWVTRSTVMFGNNNDDSLFGDTHFYDPVRIVGALNSRWELPVQSLDLWANVPIVPDPINPGTGLPAYGTHLESWKRFDAAGINLLTHLATGPAIVGSTGGATPLGSATGNNMIASSIAVSSDMGLDPNCTGCLANADPTNFHVRALSLDEMGTKVGDLAQGQRRSYGNGSYIDVKGYAIDENGQVRNLGDLLNQGFFNAMLDLSFRTFQEVEIGSNMFHSDIDVVSQMMMWATITQTDNTL